ncbi:SoxR reducing system protein RseC, partial [Erwinia amylovora]|nr:SoxR reducing system protein RseC [Erwinia amylovora]
MMKEWATVVSWQDVIATLHAEMKTSFHSCSARKGCGSHKLEKLGPKKAHVMKIASAE